MPRGWRRLSTRLSSTTPLGIRLWRVAGAGGGQKEDAVESPLCYVNITYAEVQQVNMVDDLMETIQLNGSLLQVVNGNPLHPVRDGFEIAPRSVF